MNIGKRTLVAAVSVGFTIAGGLAFGNSLLNAFAALSTVGQTIASGSVCGVFGTLAYGAIRKLE